MGFAEALSDDGTLTGRGHPITRGIVCGLLTALGGLGHTLPYLIPNYRTATAIAAAVVIIELAVISWIRHRYMDTPLTSALFQVMVGGFIVFLTGILIGSSWRNVIASRSGIFFGQHLLTTESRTARRDSRPHDVVSMRSLPRAAQHVFLFILGLVFFHLEMEPAQFVERIGPLLRFLLALRCEVQLVGAAERKRPFAVLLLPAAEFVGQLAAWGRKYDERQNAVFFGLARPTADDPRHISLSSRIGALRRSLGLEDRHSYAN
jgi:hypothetical protein